MSCNQQKVFLLESACWRSAVCQDQRQTSVGINGNHEGVFSTDMLSIGRGSLDFKHFKVFDTLSFKCDQCIFQLKITEIIDIL